MDKDTKDILKFGIGAVTVMALVLLGLWFFTGGTKKTPHRHGSGELHSH